MLDYNTGTLMAASDDEASLAPLLKVMLTWAQVEGIHSSEARVLIVVDNEPDSSDSFRYAEDCKKFGLGGDENLICFVPSDREFESTKKYVLHRLCSRTGDYYEYFINVVEEAPAELQLMDSNCLWGVFVNTGENSGENLFYMKLFAFVDTENRMQELGKGLDSVKQIKFLYDKVLNRMVPAKVSHNAKDSKDSEDSEDSGESPAVSKEVSELLNDLRQNVTTYLTSIKYDNALSLAVSKLILSYFKTLFVATEKFHATYDDPQIFLQSLLKENFSSKERRLRKAVWDLTAVQMEGLLGTIQNLEKSSKGLKSEQEVCWRQTSHVLRCFLISIHPKASLQSQYTKDCDTSLRGLSSAKLARKLR